MLRPPDRAAVGASAMETHRYRQPAPGQAFVDIVDGEAAEKTKVTNA